MVDALAGWIELRRTLSWPDAGRIDGAVRGDRDGFRHFIATFVARRGEERAAHLTAALDLARADAASGCELTLERLSAWHSVALPQDLRTEFRVSDAYAKRGWNDTE